MAASGMGGATRGDTRNYSHSIAVRFELEAAPPCHDGRQALGRIDPDSRMLIIDTQDARTH